MLPGIFSSRSDEEIPLEKKDMPRDMSTISADAKVAGIVLKPEIFKRRRFTTIGYGMDPSPKNNYTYRSKKPYGATRVSP
mmetsp:Transcript_6868/g.11078  ORF Transcript_6868/g.11078 Transcript_6868/m.11078 type:complete len:80 (-) Transcript_6868:368-607(-)